MESMNNKEWRCVCVCVCVCICFENYLFFNGNCSVKEMFAKKKRKAVFIEISLWILKSSYCHKCLRLWFHQPKVPPGYSLVNNLSSYLISPRNYWSLFCTDSLVFLESLLNGITSHAASGVAGFSHRVLWHWGFSFQEATSFVPAPLTWVCTRRTESRTPCGIDFLYILYFFVSHIC